MMCGLLMPNDDYFTAQQLSGYCAPMKEILRSNLQIVAQRLDAYLETEIKKNLLRWNGKRLSA